MANEEIVEEMYYWADSVGKFEELHNRVKELTKLNLCKNYVDCVETAFQQIKNEMCLSVEQMA
jgi:hypothetical protein